MNHYQNKIFSFLIPNHPRDFPFRRSIRISFRTIHIFTAGVLLGGHIFNQPINILEPWLWATVISGLIILLTDMHASMAVLFEIRGVAVLIKIILILLVPVFWEHRILLLLSALVIGAVSSHMPKRYRHKLIFFQRQFQPDLRGG